MPTRRNPLYGGFNDPAFAQAAQGLGALFAPPSGTDAAGFANAAKTKQETQFLTDLYTATQNAQQTGNVRGMDPWVFALGRNAGNTFAGHGMSLQNDLDKQRLVESAAMDRLRITDDTERFKSTNQRGSALDVALVSPIAGNATRVLPPSIAAQYALPQIQSGVVETKPGEDSYLPDGRVLRGRDVPLTLDQQRARTVAGLPQGQQNVFALSGDGVVAARDPATGQVIQTTRADAVARGLTPVDVGAIQQGENALATERAKGVNVSQGGTVVLSPGEAAARNLPQTLTGAQELAPNRQVVVPTYSNGQMTTQTFSGPDKPDTVDAVKAAELKRLRDSGVIDDQMMAAILAGNLDLKVVQRPDGSAGYELATKAIGMPAGTPPTTRDDRFGAYIVDGPNGKQTLPARFDRGRNAWVDAQSGQPIPAGVSVTDMPRPQGGLNDLGAGVANDIDKQLLNIAQADNTVDRYAALVASAPGVQGAVGRVQGTLQNLIQTGTELGQMLGVQRQELERAVASGVFSPEVVQRFGGFRTDIPAAEAMRQMLIAQVAQATTTDSQVSNRDIERVEKQIGGGDWLSNQTDTLARLAQVKQDLASRRDVLGRARTTGSRYWPGGAPPPAAAAAAAPPAAAPAGPRQIQTPAGTVTIQRVQ
jgi:hypothetical protein